jgi:hypothetical protein
MNQHEHQANEYERAAALAAFSEYTHVGALYVLRGRPDVVELAIKRVVEAGVESLERYLGEK